MKSTKEEANVEEFTDLSNEEIVLNSNNLNDQSTDKTSNDDLNATNLNYTNSKDLYDKLFKKDLNASKLSLDIENTSKWILCLDWNIHGQLIQILNDFIKILLFDNKIIFVNEKQLIKKNENLVKILTKLSLKQIKSNKTKPTKLGGKLVMNLDNVFRYEIIDQLIKNECIGIRYKNKINNKDKKILVEDNKKLVSKLMNLPVEYVNIEDYSSEKELEDDENEFNLKKNICDLKDEFIGLKKQLEDGKNKDETNLFINLKNRSKKIMNYFRKPIEYKINFSLNNLEQFFDKNDSFYRKSFTYLNYEFKVYLESKLDEIDGIRYLEFSLYVYNNNENNVNWKLKTSNELILKSINLPDKPDKNVMFKCEFNNSRNCFGPLKFISSDELFDIDNYFIRDKCIYLEFRLKGSKLN